jgi:acyl dehydratase
MNGSVMKETSIPGLGYKATHQAREEIGKQSIRRFAQTVGDKDPLYSDEEYAEQSRHGGIIAPPTLIFELGYDLGEEIDRETGIQLGLGSYLGYPKNIQRVGNEYDMLEAVRPDDLITAERKVIEVREKEGKSGKWVFITSEIRYTNQRGTLLAVNKEAVACRY